MPRHDYRCPRCGSTEWDLYRPVTERASDNPPWCSTCHVDRGESRRMDWIPAVGRMDAGSGSGFTAFDTYVTQPDGSERLTHISSLHQLRGVERTSEQAARNGEGQQLVWRDYSNDRSNADQHAFIRKDPGQIVREELDAERAALRSRGIIGGRVVGGAAMDAALGPGVTDATVSPFSAD